MQYLVLSALLAATIGVQGQESDTERQWRESLVRFVGIVANAARDLQVDGKVGIAMTDEVLDGDPEKPMAIARIPDDDPLRERVAYILYVRNSYLDDHPASGLEHGAAHEICHAVLGHTNLRDDEAIENREEIEAERCAYDYMGEDAYIAFLLAHAERKEELKDYTEMDEHEFRNLVRRSFGLPELPKP